MSPEFLALQGAVAGRFSIESELGRGGMGIVYLARDVQLDRHVAIKLLAPALAARAEMRRRFLREARIAAQCFHPHIVPIHAVEEAGDLAYFVMAFVRGETLADRLRRTGPLDAERVRRLGREIGWALSYAHERGVVHRDVKPENILLEDGTERALIADFGIALRDDAGATPVPEVAGTARFMAPEQALGERVDGRADLYALGVTLHLAATGRYPFDGRDAVAIAVQQIVSDAPTVRRHGVHLPDSLADAIDRCLAREADDRFATAAQFVAALDAAPSEQASTPQVERVRTHATAARAMAGWTAVGGATTLLLTLGEQGFGRSITSTLGLSVVLFMLVVAGLRAAEALLAARVAHREGTASDVALQALAGAESPALPLAQRVRGAVLATAGAALALAQGTLTGLGDLPGWLETTLQLSLVIAPPILLGRGAAAVLQGSRVARLARRHLDLPLVRAAARLFGGASPSASARPPVAESPTEMLLDRAADTILARLPAQLRDELRDLPAAASALAAEAQRLRAQDARLAAEERDARASATGATRLAALQAERADIRGRLGTAIAALESIRLDLLRLENGTPVGEGLTTHLRIVRDLQHRVDAEAELRALLHSPLPPERTPA